jgi:hypothetical protein
MMAGGKIKMNKEYFSKLRKSGNFIKPTVDDLIDMENIQDFTADEILEKFMVGFITLNLVRDKLAEKGLKLRGD